MRTGFGVFVVTAGVGWPAHAQVSVPVPVPVPEVQLPPVPVPSVPAPPPVPRVQVPPPPPVQVPEVPQVLPSPGGDAGGAPPQGSGVGGVVGRAIDTVSGVTGSRGSGSGSGTSDSGSGPGVPGTSSAPGITGASGAGGALGASSGSAATSGPRAGRGSRGARGRARARRRGREGIHGTRFHKRAPLVRTLRGCLDALPRMQRRALVLHYGIGRADAHSRRGAAEALHVSTTRFGLIERRGVRSLVRTSRRSGCEESGISVTGFVDTLQQIADEWSGETPGGGGVGGGEIELVSASPQGAGDVAGARESGDGAADEPGGGDGGSRAGPSLKTPFGDVAAKPDSPFFVMLLVVGLGAAAVVARSFLRAIR